MQNRLWKILLIEDDEDDYILTRVLLAEAIRNQFEMDWVSSYDSGLNTCLIGQHDVYLVDYRLGERDGLELIRQAVAEGSRAPFILMTGQGSYEVDVEAMKAGVTDYLVKGELNAPLLERTIRYAIERKQAEEALRKAHDELEIRVQERTRELGLANQVLVAEISERERAENALRESERRFRSLAETTSSAIFIVEDFKIRYANPAVKIITGFSPEELLNVDFWEIAHPAYQEVLKRSGLTNQWADLVPSRFELKLLKKTNEERWVDVTVGGIEFEGRQALVVTAFDITERDLAEQALRKAKIELETKVEERTAELRQTNDQLAQANEQLQFELAERQRVEEAVRKSEEQFRVTFEKAGFGIALVSLQDQLLKVNPSLQVILGFSEKELLGRSIASITHPDDWEEDWRYYQELIRGERQQYRLEKRYIRKDGRLVWGLLVVSMVRDAAGKPEFAIRMVEDITERKRLLEENEQQKQLMQQQKELLETIIANAPEGIVVVDKECRVLLANPAAERLYARPTPTGQDFTQNTDLKTFYPDGTPCDPRDLPLVRSALEGVTLFNQEMVILRPDSQRRDFLVSSAPILDQHGDLNGAIAILQDITQRKQDEEEMRRDEAQIEVHHLLMQYRETERLHIAQDLHDGPLQELVGITFTMTEILQATSAAGEQNEPLLIKLYAIQERLKQQIRDIRVLCSELRPPTLVPFGLEKAIRSHSDGFQKRYPGLKIDLELIPDNQLLPEKTRLALYRIYQELLNNVARHAKASDVTVRFAMDEEHASLEVIDNGIGFVVPASWVEMARQGHLGLVGAQERADGIGGEMSIISAPGAGTHVRVSVPRNPIYSVTLLDNFQDQHPGKTV